MNKTLICLSVLVLGTFIVVGYFFDVNPIQMATDFTENPAVVGTWLQKASDWATRNWQVLLSGLTGFAGAFTIFSKAYSTTKQQNKKTEEAISDQLQQTRLQYETQTTHLKNQIDINKQLEQENALLKQYQANDTLLDQKTVELTQKFDMKLASQVEAIRAEQAEIYKKIEAVKNMKQEVFVP